MTTPTADSEEESSADLVEELPAGLGDSVSLSQLAEAIAEDIAEDNGSSQEVKSLAKRVLLSVSEHYQGVFPHPNSLREFDKVVKNGAERAFSLTEKEQAHRHRCNELMLQADIRSREKYDADRRLFLWLCFVAVFTGIVGSIVLLAVGKSAWAGGLGGASLLGAGGVGFLAARRKSDNDDK